MTAYAMLLGAGGSVVLDDYFKYVTMLLPGNGTNGAQNNTFLDSSSNAFSITRNGNTTQGTFSPYGSNWSNYFDGTGDYLTVPANAAFVYSGAFTFEFWYNHSGFVTGAYSNPLCCGTTNWYFEIESDLSVRFYYNSTTYVASSANAIQKGVWSHIAAVRNGSTITLYINGTSVATDTYSTSVGSSGTSITIGYVTGGREIYGYLSNLRMTNTAVYTSAFTPSTTPLTAISGTSLLTCQSNRFVDNSGNAFAVTVSGNTSVQRFSPFSPTASYSAGTVGGSGYFDGSGDDLMVADNAALEFGSGAFTVEAWIYPTAAPGSYASIVSKYAAGSQDSYYFTLESGRQIRFGISATEVTTTTTVPLNAWSHVAATRSGNTFTIWINGISSGTFTSSASVKDTTAKTGIGNFDGYSVYFSGYIADARIVKGTAVYTSTFTPPTAPLTAITNTSLLCSMTNAGVIDNAMMNDLETVGNAQISTAQSKFGGSSMYFDGTGDYLISRNNYGFEFGTSDFTVEMWIRTTYGAGYIVGHTASGGNAWVLTFSSNLLYWVSEFNTTNLYNRSATSILDGNWHHVAVTRASGTQRMFFDGVLQGATVSDTTNYNSTTNYAVANPGGTYNAFNGYIDDLRITKGYARYTANFTAPTAAFPTK